MALTKAQKDYSSDIFIGELVHNISPILEKVR